MSGLTKLSLVGQIPTFEVDKIYQILLEREWPILDFVKPERARKLPVVLSRAIVRQLERQTG